MVRGMKTQPTLKKVYRNSSGNVKRLFNQARLLSKTNRHSLPKPQDLQQEILADVQSAGFCCSIGMHFLGCIGRKFIDYVENEPTTNLSSLTSYIQQCREITRLKSKFEVKSFAKDIFELASVESRTNTKCRMNYCLPLFRECKYITSANNKVCRKGIAIAYGFSVKLLQNYSLARRTGSISSFLSKRSAFTDGSVHNLSYKETERVFRDNLPDFSLLG